MPGPEWMKKTSQGMGFKLGFGGLTNVRQKRKEEISSVVKCVKKDRAPRVGPYSVSPDLNMPSRVRKIIF